MCGICGIASAGGAPPAPELVAGMCGLLHHRGPDDEGIHLDGPVALGMRRLSIIDVEGGHQPLANEDESVWVVQNGEIYNFPELRAELEGRHRFRTRADTEILVHGYEEWGEGLLGRLNGMFAFALWDRNSRRLLLARDRVGIKPLYYFARGGFLAFASELKALLSLPQVEARLDLQALDEYLALEYVPTPRTIIEGVRKLPPGHTLTWSAPESAFRIERYWDVDLAAAESAPRDRRSLDDQAEDLLRVLREAVRKELISDVPLGVFLSGGIDSSAIAALMTQLTPGNVKTFSIGFADPSFDESRHARLVAEHLGTEHHEERLEPELLTELLPEVTAQVDEPFADASIVPTYLLSRFARRHVTVALGGDGGDELFAGYPTLKAHRVANVYRRLPGLVRDSVIPGVVRRLPVNHDNLSFDFVAKRFVEGAAQPAAARHLRWLGSFSADQRRQLLLPEVRRELEDPDSESRLIEHHVAASGAANPLNQILYLDMKTYLEGDILVKLDRASMMVSLEARVPLLNVEVIEHVARLPLDLKLRGLRAKYLLRHALRDLLPASILKRRKKGFGIPVARWLRGPMREDLLTALSPSEIRAQGLFEPEAVRRLISEHLEGAKDNRKQLWTLLMFQHWHRNFMARPVTSAAR